MTRKRIYWIAAALTLLLAVCVLPVSYTHLDVYKRQTSDSVVAP